MTEPINYTSYQLLRLDTGNWVFKSDNLVFNRGDIRTIVETMLEHGFELDEIEFCVSDMEEKGNQYAYFGQNRMFLYSDDMPSRKGKGVA